MKKILIVAALASMVSVNALADSVTNTNSQYDVKVQYRVPGKAYSVGGESAVPFDSPSASTAPFDELTVAPGKTVNVPGKTVKVIKMIPGPDTSWMSAMDKIG